MKLPARPIASARTRTALLCILLGWAPAAFAQEAREAGAGLVVVRITTEAGGGAGSIVVDGKTLQGYSPKIVQVFPATGVVMDDQNHVLAYLGYRWVQMQRQKTTIEVITVEGLKHPGRLIGIDQNLGVAVVQALGDKLQKTPMCIRCEVRDGKMVITPLYRESGGTAFQSTQVLSVTHGHAAAEEGVWSLRVSRPLAGAGEPLLDAQDRVLGFVASQKPSRDDPSGVATVVYPLSQVLPSAQKILRRGGDVRTGWLGVYIDDAPEFTGPGVPIDRVEEGGPAYKAGLRGGDVVLRYDGKSVSGSRQFIRLVQESAAGSRVPIAVRREGRDLTLQATIEPRRPPSQVGPFEFRLPEVMRLDAWRAAAQGSGWIELGAWAGAEAIPLSQQMAAFLSIPGRSGVLVLNVLPEQGFASAGIQAGDVIVSVDDRKVENPQSLATYVKSKLGQSAVAIRVLRKGAEFTTRVAFPFLSNRNVEKPPVP